MEDETLSLSSKDSQRSGDKAGHMSECLCMCDEGKCKENMGSCRGSSRLGGWSPGEGNWVRKMNRCVGAED